MSDRLTEPKPPSSSAPLPPVEAPTAGFLLQLFLIPLVIVIIIVMVWLLFSWLAHMGTNPRDLVRDIGRVNDASWQRAYNLAELMRKPQYDHLKDDPELARELAATLTSLRDGRPQRKRDAASETDEERRLRKDAVYENRIKLEVFLCHVLGEFRVTDGLPALVAAAGPDGSNDPEGFAVRSAALGALAVQAGEVDPQVMRDDPKLMETVIANSKERGDDYAREEYDKLRSSAAFTLGMIGGEEALARLDQMLDDADANTRYNAALGLSRHGDARALPVLLEMLDPDNTEGLDDPDAQGREAIMATGRKWKQTQIVTNALRGARLLTGKQPEADYGELLAALRKVEASDLISKVRIDAKELRLELEQEVAAAK